MRRAVAVAVVTVGVMAGCSSDDSGRDATSDTTITVAVTSTTAPPDTTVAPVPLSREARLAVNDCVDVVGFPSFVIGDLRSGLGDDELQLAIEACDEAMRQLDVEDGQDALDLAVAVAELRVWLRALDLDYTMQDEVMDSTVESYNAAVEKLVDIAP